MKKIANFLRPLLFATKIYDGHCYAAAAAAFLPKRVIFDGWEEKLDALEPEAANEKKFRDPGQSHLKINFASTENLFRLLVGPNDSFQYSSLKYANRISLAMSSF